MSTHLCIKWLVLSERSIGPKFIGKLQQQIGPDQTQQTNSQV